MKRERESEREFIEINKHKKKLQIYIQQLMAAHIIVNNNKQNKKCPQYVGATSIVKSTQK